MVLGVKVDREEGIRKGELRGFDCGMWKRGIKDDLEVLRMGDWKDGVVSKWVGEVC